jgi:hypothetical protein
MTEMSRHPANERSLHMKRFAALPLAAALLIGSAGVVAAATPRADSYYTVICQVGQDAPFDAESVDARAVDQGHKDDQVLLFNTNNPYGMTCWLGPRVNT